MTRSLWTMPVLLAVLTLVGLVAALTGDAWRDWVAWVALTAPLLATFRAVHART